MGNENSVNGNNSNDAISKFWCQVSFEKKSVVSNKYCLSTAEAQNY